MNELETIKILEQKLKYLFITRDKLVLDEQIKILKNMLHDIKETKNEFINKQDENNSNKWLSIEDIGLSILNGLIMFIELKKDNPESAWNLLISAQNYAHWSNVAYKLSETTIQRNCSYHFYNIENILFPPQAFLSPGMVVSGSLCNICQKQTSECEHISGEVYMGKICNIAYTNIERMNEISIVDVPADKRCRLLRYQENSMWINKMTLASESINDVADN